MGRRFKDLKQINFYSLQEFACLSYGFNGQALNDFVKAKMKHLSKILSHF